MAKPQSDIGLIGLAVMGQNLALNIADHGFQISVFNRTTEKTDRFVAENPHTPGGLIGTRELADFVRSLSKPRKVILLVKAGAGTDAVIDEAKARLPIWKREHYADGSSEWVNCAKGSNCGN